MCTSHYRPDVDGLRAVAVLLVVIFHSGLTTFPGGFVGVDVFFVISGYLITTIIYFETREGIFTFAGFYKRRIARLMPALFAMMFATLVASALVLLPNEFKSFAKSLVAATLSVSNVFFWRENGGYFGGTLTEVPLLHTWSLSVEEQYYFVWPLIVLMLHRHLAKRWLVAITVLLFLSSLALSEWVARVTFGASYYLLPTRMFELMVGSLLALVWSDLPKLSARGNDLVSMLGLGLIIGSALLLGKSSTFPGFNALYPSLGTGLVIFAGRGHAGVVNRMLSLRPLVFTGLISYSLYLWHWPIIVGMRHLGIALTTEISFALIGASIFMGWLSWRYVERPFRHAKHATFATTFRRLYAVPLSGVIVCAVVILAADGLPARFDRQAIAMDAAIASRPAELRKRCHSETRSSHLPPSDACVLEEIAAPRATALMIGDSHANHFTGFVAEVARSAQVKVIDYTLDACLPVFDFPWGHNFHYGEVCQARNEISRQYLQAHPFDYVILSGHWPADSDYRYAHVDGRTAHDGAELGVEFRRALRRTIEAIFEQRATPVLIKDSAPGGGSPRCPLVKSLFNTGLACDAPRDKVARQGRLMDAVAAELKAEFPALIVIDPREVMCDAQRCYSAIDGVPLYLDSNHLNDTGSRLLGRKYLARHGSPFSVASSTPKEHPQPSSLD